MQNGRPLSPRAQEASSQNDSGNIRNQPGRSFSSVQPTIIELPSNTTHRNEGWQANFNDPINLPINLPPISRSARPSPSVITSQPHSVRRQRTLGSEEDTNINGIEDNLSNHPRLASDLPPVVPPRPRCTLTSKSRLTNTMSTNKVSPNRHRASNMPQSSGPGRGPVGGGGTLLSSSQSVNLPSVSPPPVPNAIPNTISNLTASSNVNITSSHSASGALSSLTHSPVNISLITPRPGPDRVQNLYVDAPLKSTVISNNIQNDLLTGSRLNMDEVNTAPASILAPSSSLSTSTSNSNSVTLPKCRKGHSSDQTDSLRIYDSVSIHRSKNSTTSSNRNSHHRHHFHHQQKSHQALSSKLHTSVIHQQPSNHQLLQSSPSTLDLKCSMLKKNMNFVDEDCKLSGSLGPDSCRNCCKKSGHLLCPNHGSSMSSSMSEQQEHGQSNINLISTLPHFTLGSPRQTSTLPSNSAIRVEQSDSIICRECGKCRCEACRAPRKLPEYWLCGNACVCSSETVVDTISCMCCVKTMFYHCGKDCYLDESTVEDSTNAFDRPCSCTGEHACARWSFMGVLGMVLPCLWCYLPLKGCAKLTQSVYQKCTATGCRCTDHTQNLESQSGNMAPVLPPKMSEHFVGGKSAPTKPGPKTPSSLTGIINSNNSMSDNSSITSSPTIPSLSSPADSEKRLLE